MSAIIAILGAVFAFFIVVLVHEAGHFVVARCCGIKVLRFSIGFGKSLFSHRAKSGVEYTIGMLPLGGYVKMQDAYSDTLNPSEGSSGVAFEKTSVFTRIAVALAGPLANFLLAILVFAIIFTVGIHRLKPIVGRVLPHSVAAQAGIQPGDQVIRIRETATPDWQSVILSLIIHAGDEDELPLTVISRSLATPTTRFLDMQGWEFDPARPDLLGSIGMLPFFPTVSAKLAVVLSNSPAAKAGLQPGDVVLRVNNQPVSDWQTLVAQLQPHPNQIVNLTIRRNGNNQTLSVLMGEQKQGGRLSGYLGVEPNVPPIPASLENHQQYPWYLAIQPATEEVWRWTYFQLVVVKKLFEGKLSMQMLGGPVSIFQSAGSASLAGLIAYLQFIALISVILGVFNLFPIPALDGGQILFCLIESVIGRPLPERAQIALTNFGIIILVILMCYATSNDLLRLFH
ncbi:MAG: RIP metalloprotease RseP [Gammaproteobacteria bacterium RIFCSPLOWO2_02_FULL_42_14]|nr:MAG: RIP metalloprotease RseP [Gammaproteobacteria bacterium RIFCSPHIGHO2_02_FULL_42_43]OGT52269.1 MAG: RIP metalloprotease RseP [Gammaproteobacteria bacterium RIFCSPHIGHO2_12_FULL_41_25]OGT61882.1 MAG: RIP metalloprotease RseP [Gammaproteobacteria bacterium RIFCSPLOWO2_02_FULL_42_14]OGT86408.1 MAG: RIP metalloprotease RseP [Gammaproteobacteria bacterium RIFCSPLOWO2_12_FULL_42_18]